MAKIWSSTVPNTQFNNISYEGNELGTGKSSLSTTSSSSSSTSTSTSPIDIGSLVVTSNNINNNNNNSPSPSRGSNVALTPKERMALETSNAEYKEFWKNLKTMHSNESRVIKTVPDLTFSWEGVNAVCEKKRNLFKSCWNKVTKNSSDNISSNGKLGSEIGRDREAIIGKWEPSSRSNDSYLHLNENKVTAISYRTSNNSSSSSSSSSSTAEDQSIESFSSSSSFGSRPNRFQVLNNGRFK